MHRAAGGGGGGGGWNRAVRRTVGLLAGMSGVRLDSGRMLWLWVPAAVTVVAAAKFADVTAGLALPFAVVGGALYYVGNAVVLGTPVRRWLIGRLGERRAWKLYEFACGLMFLSAGVSLGLSSRASHDTMDLPSAVTWGGAALLWAVGFGTKFWATWVTGLDVYYFRDLFLRQPGPLVHRGPYAFLRNPMYGVGNVHAYVPALLAESAGGLVFAAACHVCLYAFYFAVERPFVTAGAHRGTRLA
jgi:protein-S-isoprenylcysteine O-methyltransferase Ste14